MKTKTNSLLFLSFAAFLGLVGIQFYLVSNNFDLQEKAFLEEIKTDIRPILAEEKVDELEDVFLDRLQQHARAHLQTHKSIENLPMLPQAFLDSLNLQFRSFYQDYFDRKQFPYPISLYRFLDDFDLIHRSPNHSMQQQKTFPQFGLFVDIDHSAGPFYRYTDNNSLESSFYIEDSDGERSVTEVVLMRAEVSNYFYIAGIEKIILKRMRPILYFAIASILIVFAVFVYAIISFLKQKKINAVKTDFINSINHEFKTPLATLSVATKTLESNKLQANSKQYQDTIATIVRQNLRLQGLMKQVVDTALTDRHLIIEKKEEDLHGLLQHIIEDFRLRWPNMQIKQQFDAAFSSLAVSSFHWTTAIQNILDNAAKYGGGHIWITTKNEGEQFVLRVADDGMGIPKKERDKIFHKFYRIQEGNLYQAKGLGLGLYYAQKIIMAHQGSISVESNIPKGSIIIIKMPKL
ncbi:MAG: HAMP domain-containing histidine kinase [Flavobacteriaceae bacterium]|nr:HAMP domain-containing histidine kinase [Flavobacteriaceae bacterium]